MKPVYFPFTYISAPLAETLGAFFGPTVAYLPAPEAFFPSNMRHPAAGLIESRIPCVEEGERLVQACREFRAWGTQHFGEGASLKKIFSEGFYTQDLTAQIRSDILKQGKPAAVSSDSLFAARLFLMMAHELDARQEELDRELFLSAAAERALYATMNGLEIPPETGVEAMKTADPGAVMADARLSAWFRLFCLDMPQPCFFVTTSPAVVEQMQEHFPGLLSPARFENMPKAPEASFRELLTRYIAAVGQASETDINRIAPPAAGSGEAVHSSIRMDVHVLPHAGPPEIGRALANGEFPSADGASPNTVIVLCET